MYCDSSIVILSGRIALAKDPEINVLYYHLDSSLRSE